MLELRKFLSEIFVFFNKQRRFLCKFRVLRYFLRELLTLFFFVLNGGFFLEILKDGGVLKVFLNANDAKIAN